MKVKKRKTVYRKHTMKKRYSKSNHKKDSTIKCKQVKFSPKGKADIAGTVWEYILTGLQIGSPIAFNEFFPYVISTQCFNIAGFFLEFFRDDPFVMKGKGLIFLLLKLLGTIIISVGTYGIPASTKIHSILILLYLVNAVFYISGVILNTDKLTPIIEGIRKGKKVSKFDKFKVYSASNSWIILSIVTITEISLISLKLTHRF